MSTNKSVLLIDDDNDILAVFTTVLESKGYKVSKARSAEEGLAMIEKVRPDLIVLDVMMEDDTSGFHLAYKLKTKGHDPKMGKFGNIPILMITSIAAKKGMKLDPKTDGDFLPVEAYLEKPVDPEVLLKKVAELIG